MLKPFNRVLEFRVEVRGIKPPIWRRIQVSGSCTFWELHSAIQDAMGWLDSHLHAFVVRPGLRREVVAPPALAEEISRALALPTEARLRSLALALAGTPTPDHGPPTGLQIQVWNTRFDPATLTPSSHILREFLLPLDEGR